MKTTVLIYNGNEPLPKQGGMERATDALAKGLVERGISVILLCKNRNRLGETYNSPCPIHFIPSEKPQIFIKNLIRDNSITHIIDQGEGEIVGRYGFFKNRDIIFDGIVMIAVQHSSPMAIINNYRTVMMLHQGHRLKKEVYNKLILPLRKVHSKWIIKKGHHNLELNYDKIVLLSPSFINDFKYFCHSINEGKLKAIPNMNNPLIHEPNMRKNKRVLFVGRLNNNVKGCDKLLRIWKEASAEIDGWELDIVGDGPDRSWLESYALSLNLNNVNFHGFTKPDRLYKEASIFCMTSLFEGFGLVLIEAMQYGVVPIAFDSYKSVRDIITHSSDGILVPPFDEHRYAEQLRKLILDNERRERMSSVALESVKKFSKDNIIDKWIELINEK